VNQVGAVATLVVALGATACGQAPYPDLTAEADLRTRAGARKELLGPAAPGQAKPAAAAAALCKEALTLLGKPEQVAARDAPDVVLDALDDCATQSGELIRLVAFYRAALAKGPGHERFRYRLAEAFLGLGDHDEALRRARTLIADAPDNPKGLFLLGLLESARAGIDGAARQASLDAAEKAWRHLLEVDPDHKGLGRVGADQIRERLARWGDVP
jgi:tetratricopeptide (TPR) repeat protein